MSDRQRRGAGASPRETVRFYLLDHRTPLGKAVDVGLLALNLVFVAVFVVETYPVADAVEGLLWTIEVGLALVFLVEYVLRVYGAESRLGEATDPYTVVDLLAILPTLAVLVVPVPAAALNVGFLRAFRVLRALRFYRFTADEEFFFGTVSAGSGSPGRRSTSPARGAGSRPTTRTPPTARPAATSSTRSTTPASSRGPVDAGPSAAPNPSSPYSSGS